MGSLLDEYRDKYLLRDEDNPEYEARLDRSLNILLIEARNIVSEQRLEAVLQDANTPQNVLLVIGAKHYDIIE